MYTCDRCRDTGYVYGTCLECGGDGEKSNVRIVDWVASSNGIDIDPVYDSSTETCSLCSGSGIAPNYSLFCDCEKGDIRRAENWKKFFFNTIITIGIIIIIILIIVFSI